SSPWPPAWPPMAALRGRLRPEQAWRPRERPRRQRTTVWWTGCPRQRPTRRRRPWPSTRTAPGWRRRAFPSHPRRSPPRRRLRRLSLDLDDRFGPGADLSTTPLSLPPGEPFGSLSPIDSRRAILEGRRGARREDPTSAGTAHVADFDELEFDRYGEAYQLARE